MAIDLKAFEKQCGAGNLMMQSAVNVLRESDVPMLVIGKFVHGIAQNIIEGEATISDLEANEET